MAAEPDLIAGTITLTNGSDEFTGVGTSWLLSGGRAGDMIIDLPGTPYQGVVKEITSDTAGLLTKPWDGPTLTAAYRYRFQPDGSRVPAEARNLIELLGNGNNLALAGLTGSADKLPMFSGPGAMTLVSKADLINGVAVDKRLNTMEERDAYDGQADQYSVYVADVGDAFGLKNAGRAATFFRNGDTVGVWSDPAYVTGPIGETPDVTIGTVTTGAPGTDAEVTATPTVDGVELGFVIPAGEGFAFVPGGYNSGTAYALGDVVRDAGSSWIALQPTTGNAPPTLPTTSNAYWELLAQKGQDGAGTISALGEGDGISVDITDPEVPVISVAPFTGDSGSGGAIGGVPAPAAGDAAAGKVLGAGGEWIDPPSGGATSSVVTRRQRVVDFHFGCARGVGFQAAVDSGTIAFTIAAPIAAGATSFTYTGTAPGTGQLIVFLGTDEEYYTSTVSSSTAGTTTMRSPIPCDVSTGQNAWSFWNDNAHPNPIGYMAIDDHALRQDFAVWKKVFQGDPVVHGTSTVVVSTSSNVYNAGSPNSSYGWVVTPTAAASGGKWSWLPEKTGLFRAAFECNKLDFTSGNITFTVSQEGVDIGVYVVRTTDNLRHDVDFVVPKAGVPVLFTITRSSSAFIVSDLSILELVGDSLPSLNYGKHVFLGDSWVANASGVGVRIAARLSDAEIIRTGVGGNKAADLLSRFDADVGSIADVDFVWVVVGTNDIAGSVTWDVFTRNLSQIIAKIHAIGATPIIFTAFPGSDDLLTRVDLARIYMANVPYYERTIEGGSGFSYLPGGKMVCWGVAGSIGASYTSISFPKAFANATGLSVVATVSGAGSSTVNCTVSSVGTSSFLCAAEGGSATVCWQAIGNAV